MKTRKRSVWLFFVILLCLISLVLVGSSAPESAVAAPEIAPHQAVQRAWKQAQDLGMYHFATDVEQTTYPAPAVANVGRSSSTETYYLEGEINTPAQSLNLFFWQGGGNVAHQKDGIEILVEGDKTYGRQIGGMWQEIDDFSGLFAPGSDPMAYLAGAKNIQQAAAPASLQNYGLPGFIDQVTRYTFDIDGPAFAAHIRELLEEQLRRSGELPLGLNLDSSQMYRSMTGQGEIWLDGQGLPLRLLINLEMADTRTGESITAQIKTDFSDFSQDRATAAGVAAADSGKAWVELLPHLAFWTIFGAGWILFFFYRRSKRMYAAFVIAIISSMVLTPLLQSAQIAAFYDEQEVAQLEAESTQLEREALQEARDELLYSDWDPHQEPLAAESESPAKRFRPAITKQQSSIPTPRFTANAEAVMDTDGDGISDDVEVDIGTEVDNADTDGDGLNDGVEFLRLGTDPLSKDTDGDGIYDNVEIAGYVDDNGLHWYLDPNNADTNKDHRTDLLECSPLVAQDRVGDLQCPDTDGDGTPDAFDRDDDGDGVADSVDIFPDGMVDRDGKHTDGSSPNPFDNDHPFKLKVNSLESDRPVFVDFQLRTQDPDHLTYALNVLDWPSADTEGQIQHVKNTTFASQMTAAQVEAAPSMANGDMQLIPMLEITIPGDQIPLPLTKPSIDVKVQGDISGTMTLEQAADEARTKLSFTFEDSKNYTVKLYSGACPVDGSSFETLNGVSDGETHTIDHRAVNLADGAHVVVVSDGTDSVCADIGNIINGPYNNKMIDREPLQPYGISVREADGNGTLAAYIPLSMVPDETGGGREGFTARMLYEVGENASWDRAQQVRVVWLLEMLTDSCDAEGFEDDWADKLILTPFLGTDDKDAAFRTWCSEPEHRTEDQMKIVHTYDDAWYLTGLTIHEDHGLDVAVIYEDPTHGDVQYSTDLWQLSQGLGAQYLSAHDCVDENASNNPDYDPEEGICHKDGYRDISIYTNNADGAQIGNTNIYNRFDANGRVSDGNDKRWGIPKDALHVERFRYDHQDYLSYMTMTEVPQILEDNFTHSDQPTLLFAREEHYRAANLFDASKNGHVFSVNMSTSSAPVEVIAGLKWMPYQYDEGSGWSPIPVEEYWDQLEILYTDLFKLTNPDSTDKANHGRAIFARSYYVSLMQGITQQLEGEGEILSQYDTAGEDSDSFMSQLVSTGLSGANLGKAVAKWVGSLIVYLMDSYSAYFQVHKIYNSVFKGGIKSIDRLSFDALCEATSDAILTNTIDPWKAFFSGGVKGKLGAGILIAGAVAVIGLTIFGATQQSNPLEVVQVVLLGLGALGAIQIVANNAYSVIQAAKTAGSLSAAIKNGFSGATVKSQAASNKGSIIGLIIGVVIAWAAIAVQAGISYGMGGGMSGTEWGTAVAHAIAATVVAVIMFLISIIPVVGQLIAAIIALIDAVINLLCTVIFAATGEEQSESKVADWFCGGLTGLVTKIFEVLIYSGVVMVELYPEDYDRLEFFDFQADDLVYPELGISVGNKVKYSLSVTNTIDMISVPDDIGAGYRYQYNDGQLRSSSFDYQLSYTNTVELHEGLDRNTTTDWSYVDGDGPEWGDFGHTWHAPEPVYINRSVAHTDGIPFEDAGINQSIPLYLLEGWALPSQNCILGICTIWTERGTEFYELGSGLKFDVFPATLDEFYTLTAKDGGYALAWAQSEDNVSFPRLVDADGDGMPNSIDAHDNTWDNDGDGLSDKYEVKLGSNPDHRDSDGDGLADNLELLANTSPLRADSDGDGLVDGQEVFHQDIFDQNENGNTIEWLGGWEFAYNLNPDGTLETTWVIPSPLNADSEGDALTDFLEKTFGFNPNWISAPSVMTFESTISEADGSGGYAESDGFVMPGDNIYYAATVENELLDRWAHGLLDTDFPGVLSADAVDPQSFVIYPLEQQVIAGQVPVGGTAPSGVYSLTQTAGALISDWAELSQDAALWYPFEDDGDATTFADRSGSIPPQDGTCSNRIAGVGCIPVKDDGVYGGSLRFDGTARITSEYVPSDSAYAVSFWIKTTALYGGLFNIHDTPDRWLYLEDGKVKAGMSNGTTYELLASSQTYNDGDWHHIVHTFGGAAGGQKLYVDGRQVDGGTFSTGRAAVDQKIRLGYSSTRGYFIGKMDDVRVFERGLTFTEVQMLFDTPVLDLRFNENSGWVDHSLFQNDASCTGNHCPNRVDGIDGRGAEFDGRDYLTVPPDNSLRLNQGGFTIGVWIYPTETPQYCYERDFFQPTCAEYRPQPQGILGFQSGESRAYPTLQRVGNKLRFSYGGNPYFTTGDVLRAGQWNHVAVTYDGTAVLIYVNGVRVAEDSTTFTNNPPPRTNSLTVGRSGTAGTFEVKKIRVHAEKDPGKAELCVAYRDSDEDWRTVFDSQVNGGLWDSDKMPLFYDVNTGPFEFNTYSIDLRVWEDDGGQYCVTDENKGDYDPKDSIDQSLGFFSFYNYDVNRGVDKLLDIPVSQDPYRHFGLMGVTGDVTADLYIVYHNDSIPFRGVIDELLIYNRPYDANSVYDMYQAQRLSLHLEFDDPPGETSFADSSFGQHNASCGGDDCPVAGVAGRVNQSALFDGDDVLTLSNSGINQMKNGFSVAAWIQPESVSGNHRIVSSARTNSSNGFAFGTRDDGLRFTTYGRKNYDLTGLGLVAGQWVHVAAVMDENNDVSFYVNGEFQDIVAGSESAAVDNDDPLLVGATTEIGTQNRIQTFAGCIDDLNIFSNALTGGGIRSLYQQAPFFQLHLDEAQGADRFKDDSDSPAVVSCADGSCPQVGFGIDGQLGTAAQFDGEDDYLSTPYDQQIAGDFSISAWVLPSAVRNEKQPLFAHRGSSYTNFGLYIKPNSMTPQFAIRGFGVNKTLDAEANLVFESWNHIVGTYADQTMTIYINGSPQGTFNMGNRVQNYGPFVVGGHVPASVPFSGRLDEVTLYEKALSQQEAADIFHYQGKWVEERQSHDIVIDGDDPTVTLETTGPYLPNTDVQMLITASDHTSGIQKVEFGVRKPGQTGYTWSDAPACQDTTTDTAWCPTFDPSGEGTYRLRARVTDLVGHTSTETVHVYVDNHAPTAAFGFGVNALLLPTISLSQPNTWDLSLSGTITDPDIGTVAGSGVAADSLQVSLFDSNGSLVGTAPQHPKLIGNNWSLQYQILDPDPSGVYTVTLQATDEIALRVGLNENQQNLHTLETSRTIQIDAAPPASSFDLGVAADPILSGQILTGQVTERPVRVRVEWDTDAQADQLGLTITCDGLTQHQLGPDTLSPQVESYIWRGNVHRGAACQVVLTDTGGDGGTAGRVKVCGEEIETWDASFGGSHTVDFTALADACAPALDVAGVTSADSAYVSMFPGSPFYNQEPISGTVLHLPFDDLPDANGGLSFDDISSAGKAGTCEGSSCPTPGQIGHLGSAVFFDGLGDRVEISQDINQGPRDQLAVALWLYPMGTHSGMVLHKEGEFALYRSPDDGQISWMMGNTDPGWTSWHNSGFVAPQGKWTHLVLAYAGGTINMYANGELVDTYSGSGAVPNASHLVVGKWNSENFRGLVDDLQVFDRGLTVGEIQNLYLGAAPVLHLALDESWASQGTTLPDSSTWRHHGLLSSGAGDQDNKSVPGSVGPYALAFDGWNDHITIPDSNALDLQQFSLGLWLKPHTRAYRVNNPLLIKGTADWQQVNYGLYLSTGGTLRLFFHDSSCTSRQWTQVSGLPVNQWSHIFVTYNGQEIVFYMDGLEEKTVPFAGGICQNDQPVTIGKPPGGGGTDRGDIDDVIIYPRALSAFEVQNLYGAGWQSAVTAPSGSGVALSDWTASVPPGLEGEFRLNLRGVDMNAVFGQPQDAWQGSVDTLPPRVALDVEISGDIIQYTTTATDWNLVEDGFSSPCGADVITGQQYFQSPWYLALGTGEERLYQLTAQCDRSVAELPGEIGAYDTPGRSYGVAISDTLAYIADGDGGFQIIDVSDPLYPQGMASLNAGVPYAVDIAPGGPVLESDLEVESIIADPASPEINHTFTVSVTVRNHGPGAAWNFYTTLFQDGAPPECLPGVTAMSVLIPKLASGEAVTIGIPHAGLGDLNAHDIFAKADSRCDIAESDETNNVGGPLSLTAAQSDLIVESISFDPASPYANQPFTITAVISNQGTAAAQGFNTTIYIDPAAYPGCSDPGWAALSTASLVPGTSAQLIFNHPGIAVTGDHEVLAFVDSECDVSEIQEYNNVKGEWATITTMPEPDLVITNMEAETTSPQINQSFGITVTVHNQGASASGAFTTTVFLDEEPLVCLDLTGQFDAVRIANLDSLESVTVSFNHPGITTLGGHTIVAQADSHCEVGESSESNNTSYQLNINVLDPNEPDLIVEQIATEPVAPNIGETFLVSYTVKNQGLGTALNIDTTFYFDNVPSKCDEGDPDWYYAHTDTLAAGASTVVTMTHPGFDTAGVHQLYAQADGVCSVGESNEDNNIFGPHTVTAKAPDLIVQSLVLSPSAPTVSQPFSITITVENQGNGNAGAFDTGVFVNNSPMDGCQAFFGAYDQATTAGLLPGTTDVITFSHAGFADPGEHVFYAEVDDDCSVDEADEDNNIYGPDSININNGAPMPDLLVTNISVDPPAPVQYGNPVTFTVTISNQGTAAAGSFWTGYTINQPLAKCSPGVEDAVQTLSLAAGASTDLIFVNWDGFSASGDHEIYSQADYQCEEVDPDRDNNIYSTTISVAPASANVGPTAHLARIIPPMSEAPAVETFTIYERETPSAPHAETYIYAYLADLTVGLRIIDVTDPTAPFEVSALNLPGAERDIHVSGDYAYVVGQSAGLHAVDVTNPGNPVLLDTYATPGETAGLDVVGAYAFVADGLAGLHVIDISDPNALTYETTFDTLAYVYDVDVVGGYAYLADGGGGLQILDITDPLAPVFISKLADPGFSVEVVVLGDQAYMAVGSQGLAVVDVSDPANPVLERRFDTPGSANDLVVADSAQVLAYISDVDGGLRIINPADYTPESTACDAAGQCAVVQMDQTVSALVQTALVADPDADIYFPDGNSSSGLDRTAAVTVAVDTIPPTVDISPTLYTGSDYAEPRTISLRGVYSDAGGMASVEWRTTGGTWEAAAFDNGLWEADWQLDAGPLPDNDVFTLYARATDIAGHTTTISQSVTVDVLPPEAVTLSLVENGSPVNPGEILLTNPANLVLTWPESSDGAGLDDYQVRWTAQVTGSHIAEFTQTVPVAGPLTSSYLAVDGSKIFVEMGSVDVHGNQRWQSFGTVYVDSQFTPDYFTMRTGSEAAYRGWMESGCTDLGVDRRANRIYGNTPEQQLYASWNAEALRITWRGGNWDADGDLFLYLDTDAGGTDLVHDPFAETFDITLPDGMLANYMIWVQDGTTAQLLHWDGAWTVVNAGLSADRYQNTLDADDGILVTDLYLSFDLIGMNPGDGLGLLGLASENDSLNLWATLPAANPVNSRKALGRLFTLDDVGDFQLSHFYHWDALTAGICPNGSDFPEAGAYLDTDVRVSISADPAGASFNLLKDGLYWLQNLLLGSPPPDVSTQLDFLVSSQTPLSDGQTVNYTLTYRNLGDDTAYGVLADLAPQYAMTLPGGRTVLIGDIPPGVDGEITFAGVVDTRVSVEPWAGVAVEIYDAAHPDTGDPIEWLWTHHRVDNTSPEFFGIGQPTYLVAPGTNAIAGYAFDPAGVANIDLQAQGPSGTETLNCPDATPMDGSWTCNWEVTGQNNDLFTVQLQATDTYGQSSEWGTEHTFMLDAQPPTVTVDVDVTTALSGTILGGSSLTLYGDIQDNGGLGEVDVCVDGDCQQADLRLQPGQETVRLSDVPGAVTPINNGTTCGGNEIVVTYDVIEPFKVGNVQVGFLAEHARRADLHVTLISPAATAVQLLTDDGISWTDFDSADFWFADHASIGFAEALGDHAPGVPEFEHLVRPDQPLQVFLGEAAQGTWTLKICDLNPGTDDGAYLGSQLALMPQGPYSKSGRWSQRIQIPVDDDLDYVTKEIQIFGQDLVGNRTDDPLVLEVVIDNVPPTVTVTTEVTAGVLGGSEIVLGGTIADSGPMVDAYVDVYPPVGDPYSARVDRPDARSAFGAAGVSDAWEFEMDFSYQGIYTLWVTARDAAGNATTVGPFEIDVHPLSVLYLPGVMRDYYAEPQFDAPDLVVEHILVTEDNAQIIIANHGTAAVEEAFWIDLYVNPDPLPTRVKQSWDELGSQGLVWGVTDVSALVPGGTLILDMNHPSYRPDYSLLQGQFVPEMAVYVQVDSFAETDFGGVLEIHEFEGSAYNNVSGPVYPLPVSLNANQFAAGDLVGEGGALKVLPWRPPLKK